MNGLGDMRVNMLRSDGNEARFNTLKEAKDPCNQSEQFRIHNSLHL